MPARQKKRSIRQVYNDDESLCEVEPPAKRARRNTKTPPKLRATDTQVEDIDEDNSNDSESDEEMDHPNDSGSESADSKHSHTVFRVAPPRPSFYDPALRYNLKRTQSMDETPDSTGVPQLTRMPSSQTSDHDFSPKEEEEHSTSTTTRTSRRLTKPSRSSRSTTTTTTTPSRRNTRPKTRTPVRRSNRTVTPVARRNPPKTHRKQKSVSPPPYPTQPFRPSLSPAVYAPHPVLPVVLRGSSSTRARPARPTPRGADGKNAVSLVFGIVVVVVMVLSAVSIYVDGNFYSFVASKSTSTCFVSYDECVNLHGENFKQDLCQSTSRTNYACHNPPLNGDKTDSGGKVSGVDAYKRNIRGGTRRDEIVAEYEREVQLLQEQIKSLKFEKSELRFANGNLLKDVNGGAQREGMCDAALAECKKRKQKSEKAVEALNEKLDSCRSDVRDFEKKWCV